MEAETKQVACLYFDLTFERGHNSSLENVSIQNSEGTDLVLAARRPVAAEESAMLSRGLCLQRAEVHGAVFVPRLALAGPVRSDVTFSDSGNFS